MTIARYWEAPNRDTSVTAFADNRDTNKIQISHNVRMLIMARMHRHPRANLPH